MHSISQRLEIIYEAYRKFGEKNGFTASQSALARYLGVPQPTWARWLGKGQLPSPPALKTIHDKLGFSYDWLISGEGEMYDETAERMAEQSREIQRLQAIILAGAADKKASPDTGEAAGGQS